MASASFAFSSSGNSGNGSGSGSGGRATRKSQRCEEAGSRCCCSRATREADNDEAIEETAARATAKAAAEKALKPLSEALFPVA